MLPVHISYSGLKDWATCPHYYKLVQIDKLKGFQGNLYTAFGNALHDTCKEKVENHSLNEEKHFDLSFLVTLETLPKEVKESLKVKDLENMRTQGKELSTLILPSLKAQFGNFELVSAEERLYVPIDEYEENKYMFKGFIDLVVKTDDGKYHVIDWKTCSWGWDRKKRSDPLVTYQLTLYKHYFAKKHDIDPKDIETHFALMKRTAKKDKVEFVRVTSGPKKTSNALNLLTKALYNVTKGRFIKNRLSCRGCNFYKTENCK